MWKKAIPVDRVVIDSFSVEFIRSSVLPSEADVTVT